MTDNDKTALTLNLMGAVLEAIDEAGDPINGAPASILHLGLSTLGISFGSIQNLLDGMTEAGALMRRNHAYFITDAGRKAARVISERLAN